MVKIPIKQYTSITDLLFGQNDPSKIVKIHSGFERASERVQNLKTSDYKVV